MSWRQDHAYLLRAGFKPLYEDWLVSGCVIEAALVCYAHQAGTVQTLIQRYRIPVDSDGVMQSEPFELVKDRLYRQMVDVVNEQDLTGIMNVQDLLTGYLGGSEALGRILESEQVTRLETGRRIRQEWEDNYLWRRE